MTSKCWYVTFWFNRVSVEALIDSHAEGSVMSSSVFKTISSTCYSCFIPDLIRFRGIGGTQMSQGIADFIFAIGDSELSIPLLAVEPFDPWNGIVSWIC